MHSDNTPHTASDPGVENSADSETAMRPETAELCFTPARELARALRAREVSATEVVRALACGMHPLADGSDMGGSLRNPASFCNVVGFRPSPGRVPSWPVADGWFTMAVQGPLARSVDDVALLLSVLAGPIRAARSPWASPAQTSPNCRSGSRAGCGWRGRRTWGECWVSDRDGIVQWPCSSGASRSSVFSMKIRGAVLERIGAPAPYVESTPLVVDELDLGEPGPGEILVRIEAAGLCHSDLSVVDGNRVRPVPMLLGHEAAGRIERIGPGGSDLRVGQRVVMTFLPRCGDCEGCATNGRTPCVPGSVANNAGELLGGGRRLLRGGETIQHHLGVSGFATHAVVDRRSVVPVDDDVPPEIASVLGCAVLTGGGALLNSAKPGQGDRIMVVGLGGVGMAAVLVAASLRKDLGSEVIAVDTLPERLSLATELGATQVYTPVQLAERGIVAEVVVEAAGNVRAFETAVAATAAGGTTVTVGLPNPEARASISPLGLVAQGRSIVGSYLGSAVPSRDIPEYVRMWREGRLPVERLVSSRIRLGDINHAMDELAAGHGLRQVIVFD